MSDVREQLAGRVQEGDRDALVQFIEHCKPQLTGYIQKNLSDALKRKVEAADILQEVSIAALDPSFDTLNLKDRDPFGWLCQLADRRIIDAHRRYVAAQKRSANKEVALDKPAGSDQRGMIELLVASMTSPSRAFSRDQREFHLQQSLETLSPEGQEVLRLRYVENLPTKEIAERVGKSDVAVRVLLSRTLSRLQSILSQNTLFESFQVGRREE